MERTGNLWDRLVPKLESMREQLHGRSPHVAKQRTYDDMRLDWWTSGFWPGMLWIAYEMTGDEAFYREAWSWDERFEPLFVQENNLHHDVGFQFLPTAVTKHRLTGDADARRRGLLAASYLAGRFNLAGRFLRAWNPIASPSAWNYHNTGWAIIDSMMNVSLLFWASEEIADPRFRHIAAAHADTVLERFVRPDGSVCHICSFDPETGAFLESVGGQGFGPDSAWSRGAAWALYGLANTFRYTGEKRFLDGAKRVADFFVASLEEDGVPLWDFRAHPREGEPRDTSAAACAASGLLELADLAGDRRYAAEATRMLDALDRLHATWDDPDHEAILRGATGHRPAGQNIDVSLIYGDYFFVEASAKLAGWRGRVF